MATLAEKPKSYVVTATFKGSWPMWRTYTWHYHDLRAANQHLKWMVGQIEEQNSGGKGSRKNVLTEFHFEERLRSKKLDKEFPPLAKFKRPKGREHPPGGVEALPEFPTE